jgi:hypothetical protein
MTPTRKKLVDMITNPDAAYNMPMAELLPLQLQAAQELFAERVNQIPLVKKRAEDADITGIRKLDDLVPLLFAHTVYKSYPQSFVDNNRWDRMLQWLQTLSVSDVSNVDLRGVNNVDDWLDRLWAAGHCVLATSGSSGKCSFLNHTQGDKAAKQHHFKYTTGWPYVRSEPTRKVFWLGPINGYNSAIESAQISRANWSRPGEFYALSEEPLLISEVSRAAAMRKKMMEGSATPEEIAAFDAEAAAKANKGVEEMKALADKVLDARHEPILLSGLWAQHMQIIKRARERGIPDGDFHSESIIQAGGGIKGIPLPPDYKEQVDRFYGNVVRPGAYGMTELSQVMPRCEAGRYHHAPALIWLVTNEIGDRLLTREQDADENGVAVGRFAFLDLVYEGRWGGLITGDKVSIDFNEKCPCGRHGPTLLDNITRFAQTGQDDHIGCAGTIDSYIRGALNA